MLARSLLYLLPCACALAQDTDSTPQATKTFHFTGSADAFYSFKLGHPGNQTADFAINDGLALGSAFLTIQGDFSKFGFLVQAGYGELFSAMDPDDPWAGPNRYLSQAYVSYKPIRNSSLQLDFGKFYSTYGAEAPERYNNFNYTSSLLIDMGGPSYHLGVRSTIPITKSLSVGAQLLNGCNKAGKIDADKMLGLFTISWTRPKWSWTQVYMVGPERIGVSDGFRHFHDSVLTYSPRPWMSSYFEALHSTERWVQGGSASWYGLAGAARFSPFQKWSFSPRLDWLADSTGFNTGLAQQLKEVTFTAEYRPASYLITRAEYRRDWSNQPFFDRGAALAASKEQNTFLVAWIFVVRRER